MEQDMKDNTIYFADNGRRICSKCAGYSARTSGLDISGAPIEQASVEDVRHWYETFGEALACECGKTQVTLLTVSYA